MKKGNIYRFEDLRSINGIPEIEGYRIVENHTIDSFFKTLNSHSTDLYAVRLYTQEKVTTLMYGSVVGSNSQMTASKANARHGKWLRSQLSAFASTAPELVSHPALHAHPPWATTATHLGGSTQHPPLITNNK